MYRYIIHVYICIHMCIYIYIYISKVQMSGARETSEVNFSRVYGQFQN